MAVINVQAAAISGVVALAAIMALHNQFNSSNKTISSTDSVSRSTDTDKPPAAAVLREVSTSTNNANFDFFYFVQQWPGSSCDTKSGCCYPTTGKPAAEFSIHGLWPNNNDGSYPSNCGDGSNSFDPSLISDLKSELQRYWDTLACPSGDGTKFWSHEWNKHGTCSGLDQRSYFQATLDLRKRIDILAALQSAGINANDNSYGIEKIQEALTQSIGETPGIQCNKDASKNTQLYQVYFCVDTDASTIIKCPILPHASCSSKVMIPSF